MLPLALRSFPYCSFPIKGERRIPAAPCLCLILVNPPGESKVKPPVFLSGWPMTLSYRRPDDAHTGAVRIRGRDPAGRVAVSIISAFQAEPPGPYLWR